MSQYFYRGKVERLKTNINIDVVPTHARIEAIVLFVCDRYDLNWRCLDQVNKTLPSWFAKTMIVYAMREVLKCRMRDVKEYFSISINVNNSTLRHTNCMRVPKYERVYLELQEKLRQQTIKYLFE